MNNYTIAKIVTEVKKQRPLVQAITNYVTINDCANILLSFGASPAMCEAREEVGEFAALAGALYLNTGTLTAEQREAMLIAANAASQAGTPVILDPVGVGGISSKIDFVHILLEKQQISIIKGNVGEIKTLAGFAGAVKGVDSTDDGENIIAACKELAQRYKTIVIATGEIDTISDGSQVMQIHNGHPLLTMVSGTGCMVGALVAATAAVEKDLFLAAAAAVVVMGIAGEMAALGMEDDFLPGTFRMRLIDAIYKTSEQDIIKGGKFSWL